MNKRDVFVYIPGFSKTDLHKKYVIKTFYLAHFLNKIIY